jgi:cytochrome c oxidase assembly protein subunit 15
MEVKGRTFQGASVATALSVYVLIVLGGLVASTDSGLACPDWPLCNGQILPSLTISVLIEFTHRLWTIEVTTAVIVTMLMAWKFYKRISKITFFATLTFLLLLAQITLGMLTVQTKTLPVVVTAHLGMATLVFASALITCIFSFINPKGVQ